MQKHLCNSLLAFFGGLFGAGVLFIIFYLIFGAAGFEDPFPPTLLGIFLNYLILASLFEEGTKFLLIKRNIGQFPYGFLLGFGFGIGETILRYPLSDFGTVPGRRMDCPHKRTFSVFVTTQLLPRNDVRRPNLANKV